MANDSTSSKMDTFVKLVLIFFISLLSFAVGTFVGKGVSDSEYREAALERDDYKSFNQAAEEGHQSEAENKGTLSEEEVAHLAEQFVNEEKGSSHSESESAPRQPSSQEEGGYKHLTGHKSKAGSHEPSSKTHSEPKAKNSHETTHASKPQEKHEAKQKTSHHSAVDKAAHRVAHGKAPIKDAQKARQPDSVYPAGVASSAVGKYTVQVASFASEKEAQEQAAHLKSKGYHAFYIPAVVKGNTWYRVGIGLFASRKLALEYQGTIQKEAHLSQAIVQKIMK